MTAYALALLPLVALALLVWSASVLLADLSIVDPVWSWFFMLAGATWWWHAGAPADARSVLVLVLVGLWGVRLSVYLWRRKWGAPEDYRYTTMRKGWGPRTWWLSLFTVFLLQALLAWLVAAPLFAAIGAAVPLGLFDALGVVLWSVGFVFQAVGDAQLERFKARNTTGDGVCDGGVWAWTRHPNYFGEFCMWWGIWLLALAAGGGWSVFGPLLISFLLLRVSGVAMLERTIADRRPAYRDYAQRVPAFFPRPFVRRSHVG